MGCQSVGQKKAVLLSFRLNDNYVQAAGEHVQFYDKVPTKFANWTEAQFKEAGVRVVPPAVARRGSFIAAGAVLMPSYVNIGAYVDQGAMLIHGRLLVHVLKSVKTCIYQAALASAVY